MTLNEWQRAEFADWDIWNITLEDDFEEDARELVLIEGGLYE